MTNPPQRVPWRALLAVLATVLGGGLLFTVVDEDPDGPGPAPAKRTITIKLGGPKTPATDPTLEVSKVAVSQAAKAELGDHDGLRTEAPPGLAPEELDAIAAQQDGLAADDNLPVVSPLAAPSQRGCDTRLVRNYSSRRGVAPRLLVPHFTVSANRPGWSDVFAIVGLFDRSSFAASSHYVIDAEGHCAYIVRESDKAWTQAALNPVSISVEIINSGREGRLMDAAGYAKIGRVFADAAKRWRIPIRKAVVRDGVVIRSGLIDHRGLGRAGGGHEDVTRAYPDGVDRILAATLKAAGSSSYRPTSTDRVTCRKLRWWRSSGRPHGKPEANAVRRRTALASRRVTCTASGPVRAR